MIVARYFDDYKLSTVRETLGRTITETDFVIHAGQTGDFYPHHMDAEWCKAQPFGQRIAHGTLIFSVAVGMTAVSPSLASDAVIAPIPPIGTRHSPVPLPITW